MPKSVKGNFKLANSFLILAHNASFNPISNKTVLHVNVLKNC